MIDPCDSGSSGPAAPCGSTKAHILCEQQGNMVGSEVAWHAWWYGMRTPACRAIDLLGYHFDMP